MISRRENRSERGFTMLEMILALSIMALILAMVASSFNVVAHSKVDAEQRLDADRQGRALLWQLTNELRGAVLTPLAPSNTLLIGAAHVGMNMPLDSLTVSTLSAGHRRSVTGFGAEEIVTYTAEPNHKHRGTFVLMRSQSSALQRGVGSQGPRAMIVADNVVALRIRYFNGVQWRENWDSTQIAANIALPLAVSITLELAASNGRTMVYSTQVELPMAIGLW
ncbi:MAG TPA: type II secretion system protein GspJ [Candidatus Binataceae bacterium]|nr:type II secretion system protein GspJ [Candidatus Binataceae bacterium]